MRAFLRNRQDNFVPVTQYPDTKRQGNAIDSDT